MFSDTFAGIAPASVPGFVVAQLVRAGCVAVGVVRTLYPDVTPDEAADVIVPHSAPVARDLAHDGPRLTPRGSTTA